MSRSCCSRAGGPSLNHWGSSAAAASGKGRPFSFAIYLLRLRFTRRPSLAIGPLPVRGAVAEWSKAHAWKVCMGQKLIEGSNPSRSAKLLLLLFLFQRLGFSPPFSGGLRGQPHRNLRFEVV
jgi:hypothetical protein